MRVRTESAIVMRYSYALPADYDMSIVRDRVASKGRAFDGLSGLVFKTFLLQEIPRHGRNSYGSLYLWANVGAALGFLEGHLFEKLVAAFGRPRIDLWPYPMLFEDGEVELARFVYQSAETIGDSETPSAWTERRGFRDVPGSIARLACVSTRDWTGTVFDLRAAPSDDTGLRAYPAREHEILHVSFGQ